MLLNSICCLVLLSIFPSVTIASFRTYNLDTKYEGTDFFTDWDFFTDSDPTHGYVTYTSAYEAANSGLIGANQNGPIYMGVDHTSYLDPNGAGRESVRISTKKSWTHGLFIADIAHMPNSICGTWPAFWMLGPNWPNSGEIDIIEGVNQQVDNAMTLHTSADCTVPNNPGAQLGTATSSQCDVNLSNNEGCGTTSAPGYNTYGKDFNSHGGGVYATEWTSNYIKIWFFPRHSIPYDIQQEMPRPASWPKPQAVFQGSSSCNIDSHFANHNLIFDTTFCGDWAGSVWGDDNGCSQGGRISCQQFVAGNPAAFRDAYWLVNSVKVYQVMEYST